MSSQKLSKKVWLSIIVFGLFGQIAWIIENMYFNVFVYNTITDDPGVIANMVAASAVTATLTTLIMGVLSDKLGKRKALITFGYIVWGFSTLAFAFISVENTQRLFPAANAAALTGFIVIIMDCVMTFFGSTANDSAFNAWVTDVTDVSNRGKTEAVLSAMPLIAMLIVFGALDFLTQKGEWASFYIIIGSLVIFGGILGFFLMNDKTDLKPNDENYFKNLVFGFKISTVKNHKRLYVTLLSICFVYMVQQVFMPYIIIYIRYYLKIENYAAPLAIILLAAAVVSVVFGKFIDKYGKHKFLFPGVIGVIVGCVGIFFARSVPLLALTGSVLMGALLVLVSALNGMARDLTPEDKVGHFQGIRMIFMVMLPMVTGPYIGSAVIKNSNETYTDLGVVKQVPTPYIFLAAAAVAVVSIIPMIAIYKKSEKR